MNTVANHGVIRVRKQKSDTERHSNNIVTLSVKPDLINTKMFVIFAEIPKRKITIHIGIKVFTKIIISITGLGFSVVELIIISMSRPQSSLFNIAKFETESF